MKRPHPDACGGRSREERRRAFTRVCRIAALAGLLGASHPGAAQVLPPPDPILLTNAQQIAALGPNFRSGKYRAEFEGVVLFVSPSSRRLYVQDGDVGAQLNLTIPVTSYSPGDRVAVTGTPVGGEPTVRLAQVTARILGKAPLPEAPLVPIPRLARGEQPFRHVRVRGYIRDMYSTRNGLMFLLTQEGFPFELAFSMWSHPINRDWLDAHVEVSAFSYPIYDSSSKRLTGFRLFASGTNRVHVLQPGLADRFDGRPLLSIADAARLPVDPGPRHRVSGTVTLHWPGYAYFIEDGTGAMRIDDTTPFFSPPPEADQIERERPRRLEPGERVEVIGVRHRGSSIAPALHCAEFRRVGRSSPVAPLEVTVKDLLTGRHAGRLVAVNARLVEQRGWATAKLRDNVELVLRHDNHLFHAVWEGDARAEWNLAPNSYVRLTGVIDAEKNPTGTSRAVRLLLRSPADVVPTPEPPFTRREVRLIAGGLGAVMLFGCGWIFLLRWQMRRLEGRVAERTAELARVAALASASEARTRSIVDTALDAVISMDAAGRITAWNARAESIFGWSAAEVLGKSLADTIVPPAHREAHRRGLKRYLETGEGPVLNRRIEVTALHRDGREFPAELSIAPLQIDGAPHFSAFLRDITDRKLAESRLRESEERFSKAFHATNARLAILDAESGRYLDVNEAFVRGYGHTREQVVGRTSSELGLWDDPAQREDAYETLKREGSLRDLETRVRTRTGELQVVLQSGDFISVGDRRCILSVAIDITDRKRAEAELLQNYAREKELNELKSRFVSMVSHEFRTPLGIITSSADILDAYLDRLSPGERRENIRDITEATRHMSRMMEEVLLLGRVEAGRMTFRPGPVDLAMLCGRLVDEVRSATSSRCPIHLSTAPLGEAVADEGLLRHILTNLLNNAVKYSAPGTPVEFTIERRDGLAVFTVRDRGIGIPAEDGHLIFQAFHRGRNVGDTPGTGLGMTVVKRCVELHGGRILFESAEGKGTTFIIAMPLFTAASAAENATAAPDSPAHGLSTIS